MWKRQYLIPSLQERQYRLAKEPVPSSETARFRAWKSPYRTLGKPISQAGKADVATSATDH